MWLEWFKDKVLGFFIGTFFLDTDLMFYFFLVVWVDEVVVLIIVFLSVNILFL